MNIGVVVLAAGESKRMRLVKQILPIYNTPMLKYLLGEVLNTKFHPIITVLGAHREQVVTVLENMPIGIIDNPDWSKGIGASMRMGLIGAHLITKGIEGLIFITSDMPEITSRVLERFSDLAKENTQSNLIKTFESDFPILIKAPLFDSILDLNNDDPMAVLVNNPVAKVLEFDSVFVKIETPEDYLRFLENHN